jgi:hypothetical protein
MEDRGTKACVDEIVVVVRTSNTEKVVTNREREQYLASIKLGIIACFRWLDCFSSSETQSGDVTS